MTHITFREHKFVGKAHYKCLNGHRFSRTRDDYWTENPFNKRWCDGKIDELNKEKYQSVYDQLADMECPKCGLACKPVSEPRISQRM